MEIRKARKEDLTGLLTLYTFLHGNPMPELTGSLLALWDKILAAPGYHLVVGVCGGEIASSCTLVVVPNLTQLQRPYGLIENVITHPSHRRRGYGSMVLSFAGEIAHRENCYKIMLMTGSKAPPVLDFYRRAGYNSEDKTAFIRWL